MCTGKILDNFINVIVLLLGKIIKTHKINAEVIKTKTVFA